MRYWSLLRTRLTGSAHISMNLRNIGSDNQVWEIIVEDRCTNGTKRNSVVIFAPCLASSNRCCRLHVCDEYIVPTIPHTCVNFNQIVKASD